MSEERLTVGVVLAKSAEFLKSRGIDAPRLDAELLLSHVLGCDRLKLYLRWDMIIEEPERLRMREMLRRRGSDREPLARITGQREFFGRSFRVGAAFVPRPETEWLVERVVEWARSEFPRDGATAGPSIVELCTGTGCIPISIALEVPEARVFATELHETTLQVARDNAAMLGAGARVRFTRGDLFAELAGPFDCVVSNPPYIASAEIPALMPEVAKFDPVAALDGGPVGDELLKRIAGEAVSRLRPGGLLVMEMGENQGPAMKAHLESLGAYERVRVVKDLAGLDRFVEARRMSHSTPEGG